MKETSTNKYLQLKFYKSLKEKVLRESVKSFFLRKYISVFHPTQKFLIFERKIFFKTRMPFVAAKYTSKKV